MHCWAWASVQLNKATCADEPTIGEQSGTKDVLVQMAGVSHGLLDGLKPEVIVSAGLGNGKDEKRSYSLPRHGAHIATPTVGR